MVVVMPLSSRKSKRSRSIVPITLRNSRRRSRFASVSLLGVELLFLRRKPSRFNQRQIATWLTATPACWSILSCNCASVRSGSLAIQANRCWLCCSPTAALRPGRCTRRSINPVRAWAAEIFLAQPRLTRKSSASSSSVPSPFSYAVRNFRRKSSPYAFAILACRRRTAKHCLHYLLKRSKNPESESLQEKGDPGGSPQTADKLKNNPSGAEARIDSFGLNARKPVPLKIRGYSSTWGDPGG